MRSFTQKENVAQQERPLRFRELRPDPAAREAAIQRYRRPIALILDQLQDPRNIGSMFRLADAARLSEIVLVGMPAVAGQEKIRRVARTTTGHVPYRHVPDVAACVPTMKGDLWALEWTNQSVPYHHWQGDLPIGLVIGNEQRGVSEEFLAICRGSIHLPMLGMNTSMNVSVATGIAVYGLLQQQGLLDEER